MTHVRATTDAFLSGRGIAVLSVIGLAAFAPHRRAAAWMHESDLNTPVFNHALRSRRRVTLRGQILRRGRRRRRRQSRRAPSFNPSRAISPRNLTTPGAGSPRTCIREMRLAMLTQPASDPAPSIVTAVPLPRPRLTEATLNDLQTSAAAQAYSRIPQPTDRTLLQKLSDLIPPRITLASLNPDDGIPGTGPDLAALGYDNVTAVYDISARAVYMPNGAKLEAHSGFGSLMDDPRYVDRRDVGATPPSTYDLKPRSNLFHGVQALRMIPRAATEAPCSDAPGCSPMATCSAPMAIPTAASRSRTTTSS